GIVLADGAKVAADVVVLAAGAWSRSIGGLGPELLPPVRPIKGQMLALRMDPAAPLLTHVVWAPAAYLVPRRDGRLLVGATVEEKGYDTSLTAGGMLTLLEAAWRAVPAVEELPIDEMWVGHRPGSRDDAPPAGAGPARRPLSRPGSPSHGISAPADPRRRHRPPLARWRHRGRDSPLRHRALWVASRRGGIRRNRNDASRH